MLQCIDGHKAYKILDSSSKEKFLSATNHVMLKEIKPYEKMLIQNSVIRNEKIKEMMNGKEKISKNDIRTLLSTLYPDGLCCHYYGEFFGTLRSMILDVTDKTIEMTFGSPRANDWHTFFVKAHDKKEIKVMLPQEKAAPEFYQIAY